MSQTPSYLEQLNQGRKRRPSTSIEELNRTLEDLEDRVGAMGRGGDWYPARGHQASHFARYPGFDPYRNLAAEMDRARRQEEDLAVLADLAREMHAMREEMRRGAGHDQRPIEALQAEVERLTATVADLARRDDARGSAVLKLDLDDIRSKLETVSRDSEALRDVTSRLGEAADGIVALSGGPEASGLEDRMRMLASIVDAIADQQQGSAPVVMAGLEARLDEISRALAAPPQLGAGVDGTASLDRIEARIGLLARHMEELATRHADPEIAGQVAALAARVDDLAARTDLPEETVMRLSDQIALMAERLDAFSPDGGLTETMRSVGERMEVFDAEQRALFSAMDQRMTELSDRLDRAVPAALPEFEDRLATMAVQIDAAAESLSRLDPDLVHAMHEQIAGLARMSVRPGDTAAGIDELGPRLDQIERAIHADRERLVEAAGRAAADAFGGRGSTGGEIDQLSRLADELRKLDQLTRRSDERNARTFEAIHDTLIKVVERLDALAPGSAPHAVMPLGVSTVPPLVPEIDEPVIDAPREDDEALQAKLARASRRGKASGRSPAQAAVEAAQAAVDEPASPEPAPARSSLFAGLARALGRRKATPAASAPAVEDAATGAPETPAVELDADAANLPLEPGSGAPDLNAIMRRVRDERGQQPPREPATDASKSDFIAAARRAAQAAAAEADMLKQKPAKGAASGLKRLLPSGRKTMMLGMVAVLIAIGGMQIAASLDADRAAPVAPMAELAPETTGSVAAATHAAAPTPVQRGATIEATPIANQPGATAQADAIAATIQGTTLGGTPAALSPSEPQAVKLYEVAAAIEPAALREAAEAGDPVALYAVALRHADGQGVPVDPAEAAIWFERAADSGLAPAQYRIGNMYEKGTGVSRDYAEAMRWYEEAAESGNATAMHNLAVLHATGPDGKVDNEAAVRFFREAAEHGVRDSQFNMGILAVRGVGTPQSLEEGYKWFAVVAASGDQDAAAKRDEVGRAMTADQLERAQAAAETWRARPLDPDANGVNLPAEWGETIAPSAGLESDETVSEIQRLLIAAGYDAGTADGVMGGRTRDAIAAFRRDNALSASGEVDETLTSMLAASGR